MKVPNEFKILITKKEIKESVRKISQEINTDFKDKEVLLIGILKGSFIFMADLIRNLNIANEIDFIELSSYGDRVKSSGEIDVIQGLKKDLKNKNVIIVEDIIDTGYTTSFLLDYLEEKRPHSIKLCALTSKSSRRKKEVHVDYLGFEIPNRFIVGYGLDYKEKYRNLPDIYYVEEIKEDSNFIP
ncbi:MAG: hypoxanthine phosphoribosyltransferase [Candidatus Lokiarchaeota archaeon]